MLSFGLFVLLLLIGIGVSLLVPKSAYELAHQDMVDIRMEKPSNRVKIAWGMLFVVMVLLYTVFK
jgi:SSS family solute:Na+ symporter